MHQTLFLSLFAVAMIATTTAVAQDAASTQEVPVAAAQPEPYGTFATTGAETEAEAEAGNLPAPPPFRKDDEVVKPGRLYHLSWKVDAPIIVGGTAWSVFAFSKIYSKPNIDSATVARLDKNDLNVLDRWAAGKSSDKASKTSDLFFYGSVPLPFLLVIDRRIRNNALQVGALYWEAFAITGTLYTGCDYFIDRYRPETYATQLSVGERQSGNNKNAFFAGHVAQVSTATFFMASIFDDYHPHNPWRWGMYGFAAAATGATIYLRHAAGKHFPTDLAVGTLIGVSCGILVPKLHKRMDANPRGTGLSLSPSTNGMGGYGLGAVYRF